MNKYKQRLSEPGTGILLSSTSKHTIQPTLQITSKTYKRETLDEDKRQVHEMKFTASRTRQVNQTINALGEPRSNEKPEV